MQETEEQRQIALQTAGKPLTFTGFTIYGIPGFSVSLLYNGERSVYGTDKQDFTFTFSALDIKAHSIARGTTFTMEDTASEYTFIVSDLMPDLEGMRIATCDLRELTDV